MLCPSSSNGCFPEATLFSHTVHDPHYRVHTVVRNRNAGSSWISHFIFTDFSTEAQEHFFFPSEIRINNCCGCSVHRCKVLKGKADEHA